MASRILAALDGSLKPDPVPTPTNATAAPFAGMSSQKRKRESAEPRTPRPSSKRRLPSFGQSKQPPSQLLDDLRSPDASIRPPPSPPSSPIAAPLATQSAVAILHGSGPGTFALNYDRDGRITRLDVGGEDQDQMIENFMSRDLDNLADKMKVEQAMQYLGLENIKDILPGLEVHLLPHQTIGVAWMLMQERNDHQKVFPNVRKADPSYNGGILADEMGLGKTVQMIATMAMNMPALEEKSKTTLIVVPAALLHQWKEELESKTNDLFDVHIHHGKDKLKTAEAVQSKDVIITSYQTLNLDLGNPDDDMTEQEYARWIRRYGGVLAQTKFYRVILDEAHIIRNRSTRSSKTVARVRSKYRWMLTGTPITNTLADIYGLLRFGRFRPWNDWPSFDEHVASVQLDDAPLASERARQILKPLYIRRRKDAQLEGKPLLELPKKTIEIVNEDFSEEERTIYDNYEKSVKIQVNKYIKAGTIVKHAAWVLVMILRLRQLCGHPNLILSQTDDGGDYTDKVKTEAERDLHRAMKQKGPAWVEKIKQRFLGRARAQQLDWADDPDDAEMYCPICKDMFLGNNGRIIDCGHEVCHDCVLNMITSPIAHNGIFGQGDDKQTFKHEQVIEDAQAKGLRPCPVCNTMNDLKDKNVYASAAFEPTEAELLAAWRRERESARVKAPLGQKDVKPKVEEKKVMSIMDIDLTLSDSDDDDMPDVSQILANSQKVKDEKRTKDEELLDFTMADASRSLDDDSDIEINEPSPSNARGTGKGKATSANGEPTEHVIATWRRGDGDLEPSAKMLALIRLLKDADNAGDKTIVYSQWTSMLDLIENLFTRYGVQNMRYDGKMSREARDRVIVDFRKHGSPRVILISTKCGGVGLNLVSANRVVNMDLCWNYAAESQAYDRVHRLGQEKEVFVSRLVVKNTIEERMLRLQDVKTGLADAALGEGTGAKLHKLSVREIKLLFGMVRQPENNQPARDRQISNQQTLPSAFTGGASATMGGLL